MKKLFALVSIAALIASCTNDDFLDAGQQGNQQIDLSKGIVFGIADDAVTRGSFEEGEAGFSTFWNAETDRIGVAFLNTPKGTSKTMEHQGDWCDVEGATEGGKNITSEKELGNATDKLAIYKTTKSGTKGLITSVNDDNLLTFSSDETKKASFRVFRPAFTVGDNGAETTTQRSAKFSTDADGVGTMEVALGNFSTQVQLEAGKANFANFFMVADPINEVYSSDFAVGESMDLKFERPLSLLAIKTTGYDKNVYGVLKSVKVEKTNPSQKLSSTVDATVDVAKKDADGKWKFTEGTASNEVTLKLADASGTGLDWSDDNYAYIQVLPVAKGAYTVALEFANGTVVVEKDGTADWVANGFHRITLDLNEQDVYFETSTKLIINKGDLLKDAEDFSYNGKTVTVANIKTVVANKELTKEELAILQMKYTGITSLTLKGSENLGTNLSNVAGSKVQGALTSLTLTDATEAPALDGGTLEQLATLSCPKATAVPANAYKGNTVLKNVNLPVVETIGENAFNGATGIQKISCDDPALNQLTIGTTTTDLVTSVKTKTSALTSIGAGAFGGLTSLNTIDIPSEITMAARAFGPSPLASATKVLLPQYDFSTNTMNAIVLLYGSALQEVDLSGVSEIDGDEIAFTQSTLTTVTLKEGVKITGPAFKGCSKLATVENLDKVATIGESAFEGTGLTSVTINTEAIGKNAFKKITALTSLSLGSEVKTIGEGAFNGATSLATIQNRAEVTTIGKEAFKGTGVTAFDFIETTTIGEGAFQNCTALAGAVYSNVATVAKNVFNGASTVNTFRFYKAAAIEEGALNGIKSGAGVMFNTVLTSIDAKAFTMTNSGGDDGSAADKAITGTVAVNLTLNAGQEGVNGKAWTFKGVDDKYYTLTFTSITQ
ncbi:leucine-rich repeat protein [Bacteroides sp. GD17]|uniref:leucine-rich repeat domain-containing protein n=1 Tax=Bacteroides sp. GD17 TaxID=3139826 RepID=UPI00313DAB8A